LYKSNKLYVSDEYVADKIVDKVGSGDCFMAEYTWLIPWAAWTGTLKLCNRSSLSKLFIESDATTKTVSQIEQDKIAYAKNKQAILQQILDQGMLPLFYTDSAPVSVEVIRTLYKAGVRVLEYTNRGHAALENFKILKKTFVIEAPDLFTWHRYHQDKTGSSRFHCCGCRLHCFTYSEFWSCCYLSPERYVVDTWVHDSNRDSYSSTKSGCIDKDIPRQHTRSPNSLAHTRAVRPTTIHANRWSRVWIKKI